VSNAGADGGAGTDALPPADGGAGPLDAQLAPLAGDWMSSAYLASLKARRSPRLALRAADGEHRMVAIGKGPRGWQLSEAGASGPLELLLHPGNSSGKQLDVLSPTTGAGAPAPRSLRVESRSRLLLDERRYVPVKTVAPGVSTFGEAVSALTLGGVYKDQAGKEYLFGGGQRARWAGKPVRYAVQTEFSGAAAGLDPRFDVLSIGTAADPTSEGTYAFRRLDGGKIALHRQKGRDKPEQKISGRPDLVLSAGP
jgi:hypothetical protein